MKSIKNLQSKSAQRAQKILVIAIIGLVLILGATLWLSTKFLSGQAHDVAVIKAQADAPAAQYQTLLNTKSQLGKLGDISKLLQQALPDGSNQSLIIAEINSIASDNKVSVTKLNFIDSASDTSNSSSSAEKSKNTISGVDIEPISIETGAMSYSQLINFLKQIEQNRWIMQPTNISIQPDEKNTNNISSLDLSLNLYVKKGTK